MKINKQITGQGQDIVMLHGWGCNLIHMQPIIDMLPGEYRVTNIDLPGRGKSDWNSEIQSIDGFAEKLLPHLPEKAIYIAWSISGPITISIATQHPERVEHFIGIGTTPKFVADEDWPGVPQPGFKALMEDFKSRGEKELFKERYQLEFAAFDPKPAAYYQLINILKDSDDDLDAFCQGIDICDATDLRQAFSQLQCPIDLILGDRDDCVPLEQIEKIRQLNPEGNIHLIANAYHMPFWTHPEVFKKTLQGILLG